MTTRIKRAINLVLPCPPPDRGIVWGDFYFGQSLAAALEALGHPITMQFQDTSKRLKHRLVRFWRNLQNHPSKDSVDLLLLGIPFSAPQTDRSSIAWLISNSDKFETQSAQTFSHLFVASARYADELRVNGIACETMLQCTDQRRFAPERRSISQATGVLFVGNRASHMQRPVVKYAMEAGFDVSVWGANWDGQVDGITFCGAHIPNEELGVHYASANVVLNDHRDAMLKDHFISNRVFDVLASGRPVVTEVMEGLPSKLSPGVFMYTDKTDLPHAIESAKNVDEQVLASVSRIVRAEHSFDNRARVISDVVTAL